MLERPMALVINDLYAYLSIWCKSSGTLTTISTLSIMGLTLSGMLDIHYIFRLYPSKYLLLFQKACDCCAVTRGSFRYPCQI